MDKIAVLIPCYNEEQTISKVIRDSKAALPEAIVYVYDNNSTDNSVALAKEAGAVVRYEYKQGKGNVIRRMFREIDAECYLMVDGDDTYPLEYAPEMVGKVLNENFDMVIGDRLSSTYFVENKRPFHNSGNIIVRNVINFLFGSDIRDMLTGYRAFSFLFAKSFPVLSYGFEIETEMCVHAINFNMAISQIVVNYRDRSKGSESKLNTFSDGVKVMKRIFVLFKNYRPLWFFSILSALMALVSIVFLIPIVAIYIKTGQVPNFPTLIACGTVLISSVQAFFGGLTLDSVKQKEHRDFEFRLLHVQCMKNMKTQKTDIE